MTKYDKIFNSSDISEESLSPEEAVAAIALITAIADSSLEEVDAETLGSILWDFEVFEEYSEDEITEIVDRLIAIVENESVGSLFNTAKQSLSDDIILDAYAAGVIILLDDELAIPKKQQPYLKQLQLALTIEDEEAEEIVQEIIAAFQEAENAEFADEDEDETVVVDEYGEQIYDSPLGNFSVPIPVQPEQGGRVQSQEGVVGFSDDFGTLFRIDYYPIPPEQTEEIETIGKQQYLQAILVEKYVPQAISANVSGAEIKHSEYIAEIFTGAYFVLVDMPKGSTISKQENNGNAIRLDAYRGLLTFVNGEFLYIISSQRSFFNGETPTSLEEETDTIKDKIFDFVATIEFT
ncbi:hypothetical protein [Fortiea contorta]|uniref:hypothetical protein n=1 Tax=Fortiea contorta TaxID=1892405 RepID=UPI0003498747|nr:hypothetical protein [Fortiea contorta]